MKWECAILSSVACPAVQYFPHLINGQILEKKVIEHKMCFVIFSKSMSEIFLHLRILRDI